MESDHANDMSVWTELKSLVFLRRIAIAQERLAAVAEARLAHDSRRWKDDRKPKFTEFGTFDIAEANKRYREELEAAEFGQLPEDRT